MIRPDLSSVEQVIDARWADRTPIQWPNHPFEPPDAPWLRVDWLFGEGTIGTKDGVNDVVGVLQLSVLGPKERLVGGQRETGDGALGDLADAARDMLGRERIGPVSFSAPSGPVRTFEESTRGIITSLRFTIEEQA